MAKKKRSKVDEVILDKTIVKDADTDKELTLEVNDEANNNDTDIKEKEQVVVGLVTEKNIDTDTDKVKEDVFEVKKDNKDEQKNKSYKISHRMNRAFGLFWNGQEYDY